MTNFLDKLSDHLHELTDKKTVALATPLAGIEKIEQNYDKIEESIPTIAFPFLNSIPQINQLLWEFNDKLNYPMSYSFSAILFAASVKTGNHVKIKIKNDWIESGVIFIANVGSPNSNKSHPVSYLLKPLMEQDEKSWKTYQKERRKWEGNVDKKEIDKPQWVQSLVSDITPEALNNVHQYNLNGIGVYVDELAAWFKNFNRYHKGAEQEFWLSAWSAKQIQINRKSSEPILIPHPFISVIGGIQNRILEQLAKESRGESGFVDRIIFAFPQNNLKPDFNEKELNEGFYGGWVQIIEYITHLTAAYDGSVCEMSPSAKVLHQAWLKKNKDECNALLGDSLSGTLGKFDIHLPRLILLVHILKMGEKKGDFSHIIEADVVEDAIKLADYYKQTAIIVSNILAQISLAEALPENKKQLYRELQTHFKGKDAVETGEKYKISRSAVFRFLRKKELFRHSTVTGDYSKVL